MTEPAISIEDVRLEYRIVRSQTGSFKEYAIKTLKREMRYEPLWALDGISFEVAKGEVFGIVGPNGAGKSTLMKIMARVLPPTHGRVIVRGSVAPMIELGAGFNADLTALENIVMYGTLLGHSPKRMRDRAPAIAEWAELSDYIDVPLRSYSSGMLARLAFSIATDIEPDVLVVDEVLSVGDASFQIRSEHRMKTLIERGASVVIVSHQLDMVAELSDRAMWIHKGRSVAVGDPGDVVGAYRASVDEQAVDE
ncbi:MAG TPA: ABC transporter ATP-binding protein [Acidimicrobiia bacterium]|nr:ABC transporter ATP-binding protein [Acidimicrobiia bacterium]